MKLKETKNIGTARSLMRNAILLICLATIGNSKKAYDDIKLSDLPDGIIADIRSIMMGGAVKLLGGCPAVNETDVTYYLYDREHPEDPLTISKENITSINSKKPIIFLVHGWISNAFTGGLQTLKDAYLQRYDWNVIAVDWSGLAKQFYVKSFCDLPGVGEKVSDLLCELSDQLNVKLKDVRMVGHSMGAQISGMTGQKVQEKCNQTLGRITGLDPAGPMYNLLPKAQRLDSSDAEFVDVLHTNSGQFGYITSCGTVDFYVNCGSLQPQCPGGLKELSLKELGNLALSVVTCPHTISWYYMAESVNDKSDKFRAQSCTTCLALVCLPNPLFPKLTIMGEHTPVLSTDRQSREQKFMGVIFKSQLYKI